MTVENLPDINCLGQTRWLKQHKFFLTLLKAEKSKIKVLASLVPGENLLGLQMATFLLAEPSHVEDSSVLSSLSSKDGHLSHS